MAGCNVLVSYSTLLLVKTFKSSTTSFLTTLVNLPSEVSAIPYLMYQPYALIPERGSLSNDSSITDSSPLPSISAKNSFSSSLVPVIVLLGGINVGACTSLGFSSVVGVGSGISVDFTGSGASSGLTGAGSGIGGSCAFLEGVYPSNSASNAAILITLNLSITAEGSEVVDVYSS